MKHGVLISLAFGLLVISCAHAHESTPTYDRISLSASAEREVENDTLVASLFAEHQAQRQQDVSSEVNAAIRWALTKAKAVADVKVQTTQYTTHAVYDKRTITGWRARQSLRLESQDADTLSDLIGDLQAKLSIGSINYTVSKAARDRVEASLTSEALAQFKKRASLITSDLARNSYRIVQLNVNSQGGRPQQLAYASRGMAMQEASSAPAIEAGVQTVAVQVSGTIELDSGSLSP